jgi:hypothetical protein
MQRDDLALLEIALRKWKRILLHHYFIKLVLVETIVGADHNFIAKNVELVFRSVNNCLQLDKLEVIVRNFYSF